MTTPTKFKCDKCGEPLYEAINYNEFLSCTNPKCKKDLVDKQDAGHSSQGELGLNVMGGSYDM